MTTDLQPGPRENGSPSASTETKPPMNEALPQPQPQPPLPDRLSLDPTSPHHNAAVCVHAIGIRFNHKERSDVEEYCLSEGWIRVPAGRSVDRKGRPLMIKLKGEVEAFYR